MEKPINNSHNKKRKSRPNLLFCCFSLNNGSKERKKQINQIPYDTSNKINPDSSSQQNSISQPPLNNKILFNASKVSYNTVSKNPNDNNNANPVNINIPNDFHSTLEIQSEQKSINDKNINKVNIEESQSKNTKIDIDKNDNKCESTIKTSLIKENEENININENINFNDIKNELIPLTEKVDNPIVTSRIEKASQNNPNTDKSKHFTFRDIESTTKANHTPIKSNDFILNNKNHSKLDDLNKHSNFPSLITGNIKSEREIPSKETAKTLENNEPIRNSINATNLNILNDFKNSDIATITTQNQNESPIQPININNNTNNIIEQINEQQEPIVSDEKVQPPKLFYINDISINNSQNETNSKQSIIIHNSNQTIKNNTDLNISRGSDYNEDEVEEGVSVNKKSAIKLSDTFSVVSSHVFSAPRMITVIESYAPSVYSKSIFGDTASNFMNSNGRKMMLIPPNITDNEFEITNENGDGFKVFIETPRSGNMGFRRTGQDNVSVMNNPQIREIYDKIRKKENDIKNLNDKINELMSKKQKCEEENKKYDRWIEKEESEAEKLRHMLNFLNSKQ